MKKSLFVLVICMALVLIIGCQKKEAPAEEVEEAAVATMEEEAEAPEMGEMAGPAVEMSLIEKVAKIAAAMEVDPMQGATLLKEAELTKEDYEKVLADIALDEESSKLFAEKKEEYKAEFQK